ncbi:carbohydrate esterase family 1 protein [Collybiopsis luxurians FD-317 M1]|uniref:Carboxylic ester hydrolase n=1 Tax=Collybiopsis luxurians FD-317 M1 TaxID=944289 RepID=A0A0D0CKZ2_9AGAR|nr:carbohydrate esterase family 1 protein [Collybiopsis luxurians FD-317 M1]
MSSIAFWDSRMYRPGLLSALCLLFSPLANAATQPLVQVTANIGPNPNNVGMFVYKPAKLASPLPLIVAIHECTASATIYFESTQYATLADQYGFMVVYPNSPRSGSCFDVNTPQTLTHNGGGDSQGIASMVTYSIATYGVDPSLVFVTGTSSGAMMTNVMAGSYPELFQAASVYSGVPFGCFGGASAWNSQCADGDLIQTPQQWIQGQEVFNAYPGYTGSRPKMMLWHGTADTTLYYPNYGEEIKQWTDVFGLSQTPTTTTQNDPQSGYTMTTYGSEVVGYSAAGVGHTVPVHETIDLAWFGITYVACSIDLVGHLSFQ